MPRPVQNVLKILHTIKYSEHRTNYPQKSPKVELIALLKNISTSSGEVDSEHNRTSDSDGRGCLGDNM